MKNTCFTVSLFLAFCLTGCGPFQPSWHLTASKKGDKIQLCLSNEATCPQPGGVTPAGISVYRYDSTYDNEIVWEADPDEELGATISGVITYGVAPEHWTNKKAAPPVICGKAYLVNPAITFFALKCDGSVVVFDYQHLESFFREQGPPQPTK